MIDDETRSYWDHITGEAVHGQEKGAKLDTWPIEMTNVAAITEREPSLQLVRSRPSWYARLSMLFMRTVGARLEGRTYPPGFRKTMGAMDPRLDELEIGLGVVTQSTKRFYPFSLLRKRAPLRDEIDDRQLSVSIGQDDQVPVAEWPNGERPIQLFTRWYGFAYTYPNCEVFELQDGNIES